MGEKKLKKRPSEHHDCHATSDKKASSDCSGRESLSSRAFKKAGLAHEKRKKDEGRRGNGRAANEAQVEGGFGAKKDSRIGYLPNPLI